MSGIDETFPELACPAGQGNWMGVSLCGVFALLVIRHHDASFCIYISVAHLLFCSCHQL